MARKFTQEFRDQSCDLVVKEKQSIRQTSQQLGISYHTLNGWLDKRKEQARLAQLPDVSSSDDRACIESCSIKASK